MAARHSHREPPRKPDETKRLAAAENAPGGFVNDAVVLNAVLLLESHHGLERVGAKVAVDVDRVPMLAQRSLQRRNGFTGLARRDGGWACGDRRGLGINSLRRRSTKDIRADDDECAKSDGQGVKEELHDQAKPSSQGDMDVGDQ